MVEIQKTIYDALLPLIEAYPERRAILHLEEGKGFTYREMKEEADLVSKGLLSTGLRMGNRVGILASNMAEWMIIWLALSKLGLILIPLDPGIEPLDLRYILSDSDAEVLVTTEEGLERFKEAESLGPKDQPLPVKETIVLGEGGGRGSMGYRELLDLGRNVGEEVFRSLPRPKPSDPVAIMYTSGTTGRPKGVILNSLGLVNKSMASMARQGIDHRDRLCLFFPLFHMFGNTCIALSGLLVGATLIMPSNTFDPEKVLEAMCQERCTAIFGSPSMFLSLWDHSSSKKGSWEGVKKGTIGGASCPSELMRRLVVDLGVKGLVTAYGITEASSWISMADPEDPMELKLKTVGRALPCCEVKIVDPETGEDLGIGSQGEIVTRGYLMKGYHNLPQATEQAIDRWGWFHTGDLGSMDERGYLRILGRIKDVIEIKGKEVLPAEIEEVFYHMPKVSEAYAFGVQVSKGGQELVLMARPKEGVDLTPEELWAFAKEHLEGIKRPRFYGVTKEFPKTKSGKIQRFRLQKEVDMTKLSSFE